MPLVSTEHTSIDHVTKKTVASMQSRFLSAVCVVVVARQGKEKFIIPTLLVRQP